MNNFPNAIIIGAPRSGTDTILKILSTHDQIYTAERELHYFDRNYNRGINWYKSHFEDGKQEKIICEKTANYFVSAGCAKKIKESLPEVKLIISLRNPIYRFFSHYTNWIRNGTISHKMSIIDFAKYHPEILQMGRYNLYLENYLEYFRMENIKIIIFEKFIKDISFLTEDISNFLNIKSFVKTESFHLNSSKQLFLFRNKILSKRLARVSSRLPNFIRKRINYSIDLSIEDYNFLKNEYEDNNSALSKYIDVGVWDE